MINDKIPNIEHLVLAGAGHGIFSYFAAFKTLINNNIIDIKKIKSIYATSAGAVIGILLLLDIELDIIIDYFVERPWNELFIFDSNVINIITNYGMWYNEIVIKTLKPLFSMCDISLDITMLEFYKKTNVEMYFYGTELKSFEEIEFSYKNTPNIKLIDAIYITSAIPILFKPMLYKNKYYIDGGLVNQYPIKNALKNVNDSNTIFGIKSVGDCTYEEYEIIEQQKNDKNEENSEDDEDNENDEIDENDENQENINTLNILDLLQYLILNPILKLIIPINSEIYNELNIRSCGKLSIDMIKFTIDSHENRLKLLEKGKKEKKIFIKNKYNISL